MHTFLFSMLLLMSLFYSIAYELSFTLFSTQTLSDRPGIDLGAGNNNQEENTKAGRGIEKPSPQDRNQYGSLTGTLEPANIDEAELNSVELDAYAVGVDIDFPMGGQCFIFITEGSLRVLQKMRVAQFDEGQRRPIGVSIFKTPGCYKSDGYLGTVPVPQPGSGDYIKGDEVDLGNEGATVDFAFSAMPVYSLGNGGETIRYIEGPRPADDIFNIDPDRFVDDYWPEFSMSFKSDEKNDRDKLSNKSESPPRKVGKLEKQKPITSTTIADDDEGEERKSDNGRKAATTVYENFEDDEVDNDDREEEKKVDLRKTSGKQATYDNPSLRLGSPTKKQSTPEKASQRSSQGSASRSRSGRMSRYMFSPPDSDDSGQGPQQRIYRHIYGSNNAQNVADSSSDEDQGQGQGQGQTSNTQIPITNANAQNQGQGQIQAKAQTQAQTQNTVVNNQGNAATQIRNGALTNIQPVIDWSRRRIFPNLANHRELLSNPFFANQIPGRVPTMNDLLEYDRFTSNFLGGNQFPISAIDNIRNRPDLADLPLGQAMQRVYEENMRAAGLVPQRNIFPPADDRGI